jgi:hypothetical protein
MDWSLFPIDPISLQEANEGYSERGMVTVERNSRRIRGFNLKRP